MSPFDYVNAILQNKKQLIVDDITEKSYSSFLTNRSLSYHKDCILFANEMNQRHHADKKLQFDFLLQTIRSQKRPFVKWTKAERNDDLNIIKSYFQVSSVRAKEIMGILSADQIKIIKDKMDTGGI